MTLYRSLSLLAAAAALATSARAQQTKSCDIDESKPKEVATANFMITQARSLSGAKRMDAFKKVVNSLTAKPSDANSVGRNYELGKVFFTILEDSTAPRTMTRADLGFTTDPTATVDVAVLADSTMRIVETALPECKATVGTWRRQGAWLRATQAASNLYNAGSYDSAAFYAKRSMLLDPTAPYAYSILASLAQRNNDIPAAIDYTRKAADAATSDTVFADQRRLSLFNLGILVGSQAEAATGADQKRLANEAASTFQTFLKEAPKDDNAATARASLARMLTLTGDTAAVKQTYAGVLANPSAYGDDEVVTAGVVALRAGRDSDAANLFKVVVQRNPYSRDGLYNLSAAMSNMGQHAALLPYARSLSQIDPNNPDAWLFMARGYQAAAKTEKSAATKKAMVDSVAVVFAKYEKMPTVVNVRSFIHNGADHTLSGTIKNRGTAPASYTLSVDFLDKSGAVVASKTANVGPVAPNAEGSFKVQAQGTGITGFRYTALK
jgi:tetratricopeptide (TPR) repeat protein